MARKKGRQKNNNNKYQNKTSLVKTDQSKRDLIANGQESDELVKAGPKSAAKSKQNADLFGEADKRLNVDGESDVSRGVELLTLNSNASPKVCSPRGLTNLGNTCYFNSVMQVIAQTHPLSCLLNERAHDGVEWTAKGLVNLNNWTFEKQYDDELAVILSGCQPFTCQLVNFLREMHSENTSRVVIPSSLLKEIQKKWPQFAGWSQQDSHELLRCLLDSLRCDEIRRQRKGIMTALQIPNIHGSSSNLDDDTKAKCKSFALYSSGTVVDKVFGGFILSSVTCEDCKSTSQIFEPFFDLSLPIAEEREKPPNRKENKNQISETKVDEVEKDLTQEDIKALTPKERKIRRQQKKTANRLAKQKKKEEKKIDIHNEKLENNLQSEDNLKNGDDDNDKIDNEACFNQNEVNSESTNNSEPKKENENIPQIIIEDWSDLNKRESATDDDDNDCVSSLRFLYSELEVEEKPKNCDDPNQIDWEADVEDELNDDVDKTQLDSIFMGENNTLNEMTPSLDSLSISDREKLSLVMGDISSDRRKLIEETLLPISKKESFSSSNFNLLHCLAHFTSAELLVGANKLCCETCSKNSGNKSYRNASKQMLIAVPPPVLTLHLKRFEAEGYRRANLKKINRFVEFPEHFDLAPFTSRIYNYLTRLTGLKKTNAIKYNLYGVVQHSGTLRSGHYTAYVKIRPKNQDFKKFIALEPFLPKVEQILNMIENTNIEDATTIDSDEREFDNQDISKWFHISDSSVSSSSLSAVLKAQAYILFYERVY